MRNGLRHVCYIPLTGDCKWGGREQPCNSEGSLNELERIVKELERGDLPLEDSLRLFESGMRLSSECKRQLEEAETRVELLIKKGSDVVAVPYSADKQSR